MRQKIRSMSMTTVLLVTIAMAISQGLATAQSSSISRSAQREASSTPSITEPERSAAGPATFVQHDPLEREESTSCSLRVADTVSRPSAEGDGTTSTGTPEPYTPLSDRCKFRLFLKTTYSPYTFASAGFEATEAQATGQWPHYGGGCKVGESDSVRL
jgi:hypothetical protein